MPAASGSFAMARCSRDETKRNAGGAQGGLRGLYPGVMGRSIHAAQSGELRLLQRIADLREQLHLRRRPGRRRRRLVLFQLVQTLDGKKQGKGDDHEVDNDGQEAAIGEHSALLLGLGERVGRHLRRQRDVVVREIEPARDRTDDRHDNVGDQRIDDRAECRADDHADGEIHDVAAHREFLEFLEHDSPPPPNP